MRLRPGFALPLVVLIAQGAPAQSPRTPDAERATFQLDPGLKAELVAAEPQVQSPVAMAFDEDGRLFVVEMLDYPNGPKPGDPPAGRIRRLEDRDGDGRFEHAETFADGLLFANGLLPWKGGLIVTAAPHILYLKDNDGDGRADERIVLWEGFAEENPQLRVSHPILGLDGWVYVANGQRGGKVKRPGAPAEAAIDLGTRDFRFDPRDPDTGTPTTGMGQFGNTFDDFGRRFVCTNRNHLIPIVEPDHLLRSNPAVPPRPRQTDNQGPGGAAPIFPISRNFTTFGQHSGSFSASCGITVYRGDALGPDYLGSIFTCDPTGNLVHRETLDPDGAAFRGRRVDEGREFLASSDDWFRPVSLAHGPDGALYVVDMYRAVIEHPEWMPPEVKNRPDLHDGADLGRVWRIRPEQGGSPHAPSSLGALTPAELVPILESPSAWHRSTAFRLLLERSAAGAVENLRGLVNEGRTPESRVLAAWLLADLASADGATLARWLANDADPRVREQAPLILIARGPTGAERSLAVLRPLASDPDPRVRYHAALALSWSDDPRNLPALVEIATRGADDPWTRRAVFHAARGHEPDLLLDLARSDDFFRGDDPGRRALWSDAARLVGARGDSASAVAAVEVFREIPMPDAWRLRGLAGLVEGLQAADRRLADAFSDESLAEDPRTRDTSRWTDAFARNLPELLSGSSLDPADRLAAIGLLALLPPADARPALVALVRGTSDATERLAAARVLAATFSDADVADDLLRAWDNAGPSLRRGLAALLAARPDRAGRLLDAVEAGSVAPGDLDLSLVRSLVDDAPEPLKSRARSVLADRLPADRSEVLARYQDSARTHGDVDRGRAVFARVCATCHRIADQGVAVGPDITDTLGKSREQLLHDILNPNAAVDASYVVYTAATRDGRVVSGLLASESPDALTLRQAEGRDETLRRDEIEALQATGRSLMPEGVENDVSPEQMADLLTFLKEHRYRDAGVPVPAAPR